MKVFLHIKFNGEENIDINIKGIKTKYTYKYKENNILVCIRIDKDTLYINRSCNEYDINLVFNKNKDTNSTYTVFGGNKKFILNTKTKKLNISNNKIELEYEIEEDKFKYLLEVVHEGEIN